MKMMKKYAIAVLALSLFFISCSRNGEGDNSVKKLPNTVILEWNEVAYHAFGGPAYQHSLMAARINAMTHLAMHDAINAVQPVFESYAFDGKDKQADPVAAAASAAHTVLINEIPAKKSFLDSALQKTLATISEGSAKDKGIELGKQAGQSILNDRSNDGSAGDPFGQIPPSTDPGVYQPVPPFNILFAPYWKDLKLFGLQSKDQFRSAPYPALNSVAYSTAFNEVKEIGRINSTTRTAEQTSYAKFWYEFSEAGWNRVARVVAANKKLSLVETARLFALIDMAMADAYTAGWDSKIFYNFWRPFTAIRSANNDGNDNTIADQAWEPSEPTPPVQDYPSTHSALGNAAATVLAKLLGDNTSFTMGSVTAVPAGSTRSFASFSQAANENADSRVMAGIHFRFACEAGLQMGNKVGDWIVNNHLKPLK
ncbi:MAG TPA: vanadium-dependent haloperoxidase [Chitinophagaceae bacterium]